MYPLLVSAATTIASNLIDKWAAAREAKAAAPTESFAAVLEKSSVLQTAAPGGPEARVAALRQKLLDSPEVHTLLASADPMKQPTLSLGAGGTLSASTPDGRIMPIQLSPESAAAARELAATASTTGTRNGFAGQLLPTPLTLGAIR